MLDEIFDNGKCLLGKVKWIKEYIKKNAITLIDITEIDDLLAELDNLKDDTIVAINYDNPMGYDIEHWEYNDKIWY